MSQKRINSKQKGNRGEREFAAFLREYGVDAERGQQYCGGQDSPDVITNLCIHIEVKRVNRLQISVAMAQAIKDAGNKPPIVAHRRDREEWLITLRATDFMKLAGDKLIKNDTPTN